MCSSSRMFSDLIWCKQDSKDATGKYSIFSGLSEREPYDFETYCQNVGLVP